MPAVAGAPQPSTVRSVPGRGDIRPGRRASLQRRPLALRRAGLATYPAPCRRRAFSEDWRPCGWEDVAGLNTVVLIQAGSDSELLHGFSIAVHIKQYRRVAHDDFTHKQAISFERGEVVQ